MEKNSKKIYAVVGMAGGGKTQVIEYLQKKFHWNKVYFGDVVFDQMKEDGLEMNQDNERVTREKLRSDFGMGVCAERSLPKIEKALESSDVVLLESLYSWEEYKIIKRIYPENFKVIAVYAPPVLRFSRLRNRSIRPLKTFKEFQKRDWTEIEGTDKGGPIAIADFTILNEGTVSGLNKDVDRILQCESLMKVEIDEKDLL